MVRTSAATPPVRRAGASPASPRRSAPGSNTTTAVSSPAARAHGGDIVPTRTALLCYTADAVCALYTILLKGESGEAYNVTNMDTACSIREMAELVAGLEPEAGVNVRIEIPEDIASFGYNPQMIIRLDASKLKALGYVPSVGMEDMFRRTIRSMRERI